MHIYGSVGPQLEGCEIELFWPIEAPTMRLPNVTILLCWPSRMQIYGFVQNRTFLEQFVPGHFSIWGYQDIFSNLGVPGHFFNLGVPGHFSNMIEQFVRMGVPAQFSNLGVPGHFFQSGGTTTIFHSGGTRTFFSIWGYHHNFLNLAWLPLVR